jgi:DNA polymerase III delta prime subunit
MVSFTKFNRRPDHNWIVKHLRDARRAGVALERGVTGPRFIRNVTASGLFVGDAAETLDSIKTCLRQSNRLFRQGNSIVFLMNGYSPSGACVARPLVVDGVVTKIASAVVSNVVYCREMKANSTGKGAKVDQPAEYPVEFAVPQSVLQQVVVRDNFMMGVPEARLIVSHPVFDNDFNWLDVGYHEGPRTLICGESFDPTDLPPLAEGLRPPDAVEDVLDLLPPLMRQWMRGFHWNSPTDLINYVAGPLMIVLMPMFVEAGHPAIMFWGNKPGIGKSLAAQCLAILKDGEQAAASSMEGGSKEIENQIASELNDGRTTLFFDNQKGQINCPTLEANITDAELGYRAFFTQSKIRRPNDVLWLLTTNDGQPSEDLLVRCIHVRLHYEGDPGTHQFLMTEDEVVGFVKANRAGILAEAAGMVRRWLDAGRVMVRTVGRFEKFNNIVGSVLAANGLPGFLSNTREEVCQHSTTHQQLVAIAERLLDGRDRSFVWDLEGDIDAADEEFKRSPRPENPREQKDWVHILAGAGVIPTTSTTPEKQKRAATQYLNSIVNVPVDVDVGEHTVQAKIVSRKLGGHRTAYVLAVKGLPAVIAADEGDGGAADAQPADLGAATSPAVGDQTAVPSSPNAGDGCTGLIAGAADDEGQGDYLWGPTSE